jgi:hypothetical protein
MEDRAADGTKLDPKRDFEEDYYTLNQQYDDLNRAMFTRYIRFLDEKRPPMVRKRKADTALSSVDETPTTAARKNDDTTISPVRETAEKDKNTSSHETAVSEGPPCPYVHIATLPIPPPTSPTFDSITLTDTGNRALLMRGQHLSVDANT